ncbi:monocarboxylate transporter 12-like [Patiria miniata]|uniref:Major facilitator superfamily (MFS) profile domain-containing protein n=1 Tax=Patiria miniata TaxID=46514 RepID=A0A914B884_PATMI|nr:monocarboxylate transporter 12-like [Patiria miniata]
MVRVSAMEGSRLLVLTAFAIFFVEFGTLKSFGVLFNPMQDSLQCSTAQLGTVVGMTHSLGLILAPLTGNIARTIDSRLCVMVGGGLLFVGFLATAFVNNIYQLAITLSLTGFGLSLAYIPQLVLLLVAFPERFSLMFGLAGMGGSLGMMVCPPIVDLLTMTYGWRGAMLIMAAASFNVTAFGAMQRLPSSGYEKLKKEDIQSLSDDRPRDIRSKLSAFASALVQWLSMHLCIEHPKVLLHLTVWPLLGAIFAAWMVFLVPHAIARGIPSVEAAFLSTIGGIGHLLSRAIHPFILDRKLMSAFWMFVILNLVNTVSFFLDYAAADNYLALMLLASVNGAAEGIVNWIIPSVSKELYEESGYVMDICIIGNCLFGAGEILGGFLAGALYDMTQSYSASFFSLGFMAAVTTTMCLIDRLASKCFNETN